MRIAGLVCCLVFARAEDLYAILGVEETATPAEIRAQYRKRALQLHPDKQEAGCAWMSA